MESSAQLSGSAATPSTRKRASYSASAFCASTSSRPNHASRSGGNATQAPATRSPPTRLTTISPKAARFAQRLITRWVRQNRHEHVVIEGKGWSFTDSRRATGQKGHVRSHRGQQSCTSGGRSSLPAGTFDGPWTGSWALSDDRPDSVISGALTAPNASPWPDGRRAVYQGRLCPKRELRD